MSAVAAQYKVFFDALRGTKVFPHGIPQSAVGNIHTLINACLEQGVLDFRQIAYVLGSVRGEVGQNMAPVWEGFKDSYKESVAYIKRQNYWYAKPHPISGRYHPGVGQIQPTHYDNHKYYEDLLGLPLVSQPELMLRPEVSAYIAVHGMANGVFTTKKLSDYFGPKHTQWRNARRIVNGMDRASKFAELAQTFHRALKLAFPDGVIPKYEDTKMQKPASEQSIPVAHPPVNSGQSGGVANNLITGALAWMGARLFGGEGSPVAAPGVEPANTAFDACFAAIQSGGLTSMDFVILGGAAVLAVGKMKFPVMGRISGAISVLTGSNKN